MPNERARCATRGWPLAGSQDLRGKQRQESKVEQAHDEKHDETPPPPRLGWLGRQGLLCVYHSDLLMSLLLCTIHSVLSSLAHARACSVAAPDCWERSYFTST